jgi:prophage DNA circulation protein
MDSISIPFSMNAMRASILCVVLGTAVMCHGQTFDFALTESMRVAQEVTTQLALDEVAAAKLLEAALPWDACLAHWNAYRDSVESANIEESQLLEAMAMVRSNLGACRTERSLAIRTSLDSLRRLEFDKLSLPEKPRVLHFGLHNRMDCVVCKPENNTP